MPMPPGADLRTTGKLSQRAAKYEVIIASGQTAVEPSPRSN